MIRTWRPIPARQAARDLAYLSGLLPRPRLDYEPLFWGLATGGTGKADAIAAVMQGYADAWHMNDWDGGEPPRRALRIMQRWHASGRIDAAGVFRKPFFG